jgi:hypothetical protein
VNDDELLERVRAELPPVPPHLVAIGHAAFEWLLPGATLATAAYDGDAAPAGVRGGGARLVTFAAPGVRVRIEVSDREIVGQLTPAADAEVTLRSPRARLGTRTDAAGGFLLPEVPEGPVSLLFRLPDATSVVTSWIHV